MVPADWGLESEGISTEIYQAEAGTAAWQKMNERPWLLAMDFCDQILLNAFTNYKYLLLTIILFQATVAQHE